jgi:NAD(P)-dependent dehydrogenase (short-subunit alcohol dehydrogenase family)
MVAANKVKMEGRLNALINNAGLSSKWLAITDLDVDSYWSVWTVHIKGTYLMLRPFLPLLVETAKREKTHVDIVNMTSIGAHMTSPGASAYQTSKFALLRLTEFVSSEYEEHGVSCVAVYPGGVLTAMSKTLPAIQSSMTYPSCADFLLLLTPVGLIDTPDLCGGFVVWLTKGQKSWLNGRYLSASWDVDELEARKDEITERDKLKMRMLA